MQVLLKKGPRGPEWRTFRVPFDKEHAKKKKFRKIKDKRYKVAPVSAKVKEYFEAHELPEDRLWDLFNAACRGEPGVRPPELDRGTSCYHLHYGDPYLRLGPFRLESKNLEPFVAVFRDFMYDPETEAYRKAAEPKLERSRHCNKEGNPNQASIKRTSSQVRRKSTKSMVNPTLALPCHPDLAGRG